MGKYFSRKKKELIDIMVRKFNLYILKTIYLSFYQTFFDNSCYKVNIYFIKLSIKFVYSKKQS